MKIKKKFNDYLWSGITERFKPKYWWFILSVAVPLVVYIQSVPAQVTGIGDSDELITSAIITARAHPPGYPIFLFISTLVSKIFFTANLFQAFNIFNATCQALSIGFLYLGTNLMVKSKITALVSAVAIAFSYLYWQYALVFEVFVFQQLLLSIILYVTLLLITKKQHHFWWLMTLALCGGLSVWHHQLSLPFLLVVIVTAMRRVTKNLRLAFSGSLIVFILFFGLMHYYLSQVPQTPHSWSMDPGINGWFDYVTRRDYSGFSVEKMATLASVLGKVNLQASIFSLFHYLTVSLPAHFTIFLVPILGGVYYFFKDQRIKPYRFLILLVMIYGPLLAAYLTLPNQADQEMEYFQVRGLTERMYLIGYLLYGYLIAAFLKNFNPKKGLVIGLLGLGLVIEIFTNRELFRLKTYTTIDRYSSEILLTVPDDSTIICFSDVSCFALRAQQAVNQINVQALVIPSTPQLALPIIKAYPDITRFSYTDNPFLVADMVSWHVFKKRPIYITEVPVYYRNVLGLDGSVFSLIPGLADQVVPVSDKEENSETQKTKNFNDENWSSRASFQQAFIRYWHEEIPPYSPPFKPAIQQAWNQVLEKPDNAKIRFRFAQTLLQEGIPELAKREMRHALQLDPNLLEAKDSLDKLNGVIDLR